MQAYSFNNSHSTYSEPMEFFYHNDEVGPVLADFAMDTIAKYLKIEGFLNKIFQDSYFIGYFKDDGSKNHEKDDLGEKFQQAVNMIRLFMQNKDSYLSEPTPCEEIPLELIDVDLIDLDIFQS